MAGHSALEKLGFDKDYPVFLKQVLALAVPVVAQRVVGIAVNLLDNIMVGSMGDTAISACSVANQFFMLFSSVIGGVVGGAVLIGTQAWGNNGDRSTVQRMTSAALWLCMLFSVLFFGLSFWAPESMIRIYTDKEALYAPGASYLRILAFSFLPFALTNVMTMMLQAVRDVRIGFYIECVNSLVNAVLNWLLIYGRFGLPRMGLEGAAAATVIARVVGFVIAVVYVLGVEKKLCYRLSALGRLPDLEQWKTYLKCGLPILAGDTLIMLNSMLQTMITGWISDVYIAANSIVHVIWQVAILTGMGLTQSASIIVGGDIGSGDLELAQRDGERFLLLSVVQGLMSAVMVLLIGPVLLSFYNVSPETRATAGSMIFSATIVVFALSIQFTITKGVIRSGGKTRQVLLVDILSCFCFGLPLGYLAAFILKWPPYAIYIVIRGDYFVKAIWGIAQLNRKKWIIRMVG